MGEQWKEEMFTLKHYIKVRVIQDGRPTVQASALIMPPTYNSLPVLWSPQAKCKVRLEQKQEYLFQSGGGQRYCSATIITLTVCPDILLKSWYICGCSGV